MAGILVFVAQVYFFLLYAMVGIFCDFRSPFPVEVVGLALAGTFVLLPLVACQSYLSLRIKSFAPPVVVATVLGLAGLMVVAQSQFPAVHTLFAFSNVTLLLNNQAETGIILFSDQDICQMIGWSIFLTFVFCYLQLRYVQKQVD